MMRILALLLTMMALAGCAEEPDEVVRVAFVGSQEDLVATGLRLSFPAQRVRAATAQGLVQFDASGQVVPGLAERWIVTDDGSSYIFRLKERDWTDGTPMTAQSVRDELARTLGDLEGTSLGLDLDIVRDVRAMAGRVVEIRLRRPMPQFLQLLAQPELGLRPEGNGLGPMRLVDTENAARVLMPMRPEERGLPQQDDWDAATRPIAVTALPAEKAILEFSEGRLDAVFNGQIATLPLVDTGPLASGTIRLDLARGLFGLDVQAARGFLASAENRQAISMAINRETLLAPFNIAGWQGAERLFANTQEALPEEQTEERWFDLPYEQRVALARSRVERWRAANPERPAQVTISLPEGPGSELLLRSLGRDLRNIGVELVRLTGNVEADLVLRDRVARYDSERWYLNQFNCSVSQSLCDPVADRLVAEATLEADPAQRALLLAEARTILTELGGYIPLATPIRWSLLRGNMTGFSENEWAIHPLFPLSGAPI
ncbi:ABC transporter substrate-binding protein [Parapontixanthobacter aurantiacus]|nr:ABC transporter substrate-binding protein [Parapontixanthobacter aurantiacus]